MTTKHKMYELEEQELHEEYKDGYINKQEYEAKLKEIKKLRDNRIEDKHKYVEDEND